MEKIKFEDIPFFPDSKLQEPYRTAFTAEHLAQETNRKVNLLLIKMNEIIEEINKPKEIAKKKKEG